MIMSIAEVLAGCINWTGIIVAIAAVLSAFFAYRALSQAWKIHSEQKQQNRSYFAPHDNPGGLIITEELGEKSHLKVVLVNYGGNPANNIKLKLLTYNQADIENRNTSVQPVISGYLTINNPVARNGKAIFAITGNSNGIDFSLLLSNYVVCRIEYQDAVYGNVNKDTFFWIIGPSKELMEVDPIVLRKLKEFLVLDDEFWSQRKEDQDKPEEGQENTE